MIETVLDLPGVDYAYVPGIGAAALLDRRNYTVVSRGRAYTVLGPDGTPLVSGVGETTIARRRGDLLCACGECLL